MKCLPSIARYTRPLTETRALRMRQMYDKHIGQNSQDKTVKQINNINQQKAQLLPRYSGVTTVPRHSQVY